MILASHGHGDALAVDLCHATAYWLVLDMSGKQDHLTAIVFVASVRRIEQMHSKGFKGWTELELRIVRLCKMTAGYLFVKWVQVHLELQLK